LIPRKRAAEAEPRPRQAKDASRPITAVSVRSIINKQAPTKNKRKKPTKEKIMQCHKIPKLRCINVKTFATTDIAKSIKRQQHKW